MHHDMDPDTNTLSSSQPVSVSPERLLILHLLQANTSLLPALDALVYYTSPGEEAPRSMLSVSTQSELAENEQAHSLPARPWIKLCLRTTKAYRPLRTIMTLDRFLPAEKMTQITTVGVCTTVERMLCDLIALHTQLECFHLEHLQSWRGTVTYPAVPWLSPVALDPATWTPEQATGWDTLCWGPHPADSHRMAQFITLFPAPDALQLQQNVEAALLAAGEDRWWTSRDPHILASRQRNTRIQILPHWLESYARNSTRTIMQCQRRSSDE